MQCSDLYYNHLEHKKIDYRVKYKICHSIKYIFRLITRLLLLPFLFIHWIILKYVGNSLCPLDQKKSRLVIIVKQTKLKNFRKITSFGSIVGWWGFFTRPTTFASRKNLNFHKFCATFQPHRPQKFNLNLSNQSYCKLCWYFCLKFRKIFR